MSDDRIFQIALQFEAYKDSKVPTLRGQDIVLFARQVIDEATAALENRIEEMHSEVLEMYGDRI